MIKLSENSLLSQPHREGSTTAIDLDILDQRLKEAFAECSYMNPDFCRDILATIAEYIKYVCSDGKAIGLDEIENVVVRILCNTGFCEVASKFRSRIDRLTLNDNELVYPHESLLQELLRQDHFFVDKPINKITNNLLEKLYLLGFEKVTKALLLALAKNVYLHIISGYDNGFGEAARQKPPKVWVVSPQSMESFLRIEKDPLFREGVITIKPISLLFPIIKIVVHLVKLGELSKADLFELKFYPAFDRLCIALKNTTNKLMVYVTSTDNCLGDTCRCIDILFNMKADDFTKKSSSFQKEIRNRLPELRKITSYHFPADYVIRFSTD